MKFRGEMNIVGAVTVLDERLRHVINRRLGGSDGFFFFTEAITFIFNNLINRFVFAFSFPEQLLKLFAIFNLFSRNRSEEHTSELQSRENLVCRLLLE